jgi:hypothetical protein
VDDEHEEEHESEHGMMFSIPLPDPAQIMQHIHDARDRNQMAGEVFRHEVRDLFMGLGPEQLSVLQRMLGHLCEDGATGLANFWQGWAIALLDTHHNVCAGCGKNHEEELLLATKETLDEQVDPEEQPD